MIFYKYKTDKVVEYYRKEEADEMGLAYIPWREAQSAGQWVLTDDNYVLQTVRVKHITEYQKGVCNPRVRRRVVTELGVRYPHGRPPLNISEHMKTRSYGLAPKNWWEGFKQRNPAINTGLIRLILSGELPFSKTKKYTREQIAKMDELAIKIRRNEYINGNHVRLYYNVNEVRMELMEEIKKKAAEKGVTVDKVFELYSKAEKYATDKKDAKSTVMVADRYAGIIGMTKRIVTTPQLPPQVDGEEPAFDKMINESKEVE